MPIYEYRCQHCRRRTSQLVRGPQDHRPPVCGYCGSGELVRLFSPFAIQRSPDAGRALPSFESMSDVDESDPESMKRWVEGMRHDMGEEFGGEYEETVRDMRRAERAYEDGHAHGHDHDDGASHEDEEG
ncbi:MAG: zinc ribbon domain-containing protein [Chloroflexi bacterium]|nr:zinc ribbon domain-containing protein [Chloroflexota bacterium]